MLSPTHSLMALALLSKPDQKKRNWAIFIGSAVPDAFIYVCWLWLTFISGETQEQIWSEIYFDQPMQIMAAIFNSIPLYVTLLALGYVFHKRDWGLVVLVFALAALIHMAFDFPVHTHDAYAYFEPFSNWRFHSPLSYYEVEHHARWVSTFEAIIAGASIVVLWRRFHKMWVKLILGCFAALYIVLMGITHLAPFLL